MNIDSIYTSTMRSDINLEENKHKLKDHNKRDSVLNKVNKLFK